MTVVAAVFVVFDTASVVLTHDTLPTNPLSLSFHEKGKVACYTLEVPRCMVAFYFVDGRMHYLVLFAIRYYSS